MTMKYTLSLIFIVLMVSCSVKEKQEVKDNEKPSGALPVTLQTGPGVKSASSAMLTAYLQLKDALMNYDTAMANKAAASLAAATDSVDYSGTPDTTVVKTVESYTGTIASEAMALQAEANITEKRRAFSMITENFYPLLRAIQYDQSTIYYQMCPMAFNETEAAYWISATREINNPYLGNKHPKYASGMLHCGELKDSISYAK
jgi:hypothetical protein